MPPLAVMFKTVSSDCNLDCRYCYYRQSLEGSRIHRHVSPELLGIFMPQYMEYISDVHQASLNWQGGEPTLAGLDFFRQVVEIEARNARHPTTISNAIQTNGILVSDEWSEFLAAYRFLVGVSLDGPETIHDAMRRDKGGHGSFRRVMVGIEALKKRQIDVNILCVVGEHNINSAGTLLQFYKQEGLDYLQFMPGMAFQSTEPLQPASYLVTPEQYGYFLSTLFDEWYGSGLPAVSIRIFDNFLQTLLNMENNLCVHSGSCNSGIVIEYNGDVFPCDFYIHPQWRLGNIFKDSLKDIVESDKLQSFINQKHPLPGVCRDCQWKDLCKGECPRNRTSLPVDARGVSYFCQSYEMFFNHASVRMLELAERLRNYRRFLAWQSTNKGATPSRNDRCPCGSGKKYKNCCGAASLNSSYLFHSQSTSIG